MSAWLPLRLDAIPAELRALPWIGWRAEVDAEGKTRKRPYQIGFPSELASNSEEVEAARAPVGTLQSRWIVSGSWNKKATTWTPHSRNAEPEVKHWRGEGDVRETLALAPNRFDGFGIVLTAAAGITFIDLDDVVDSTSGAIEPWAQRMVETMNAWTEISVSGTGLHIFCRGRLPGAGLVGALDGDPTRKIEVYDRARFAYLTGHVLDPVRPLADRQRLITLLAQHVRPPGASGAGATVTARPDAPIPEGQRNDTLFRIARGFVLRGLSGRALEDALVAVSRRRCAPVPPDADVVKIARHAERLPDRRPA